MAEDKKKDEIAVIEINEEFMKQKLYEFRGCKVLLDADLAEVYGYELKAFNQQVKRNIERFQNDMMFQLSDNEVEYLRSQFVTANISSKSRSNPYVFTEQGVYMLMTVLKSSCAVTTSAVITAIMNSPSMIIRLSASGASKNTSKTSTVTTFPRRWTKSVLHTASMRPARIPYRRPSSLSWKARTLRTPSETPSPLAATATPSRRSRAASQRRHTAFPTGLRTRRIPIWMSR